MIIVILKMIFLLVCWTMGWRVIISEGMLFEKLGEWAEKKAETNKWFDAIICPWCIPNIQGLLFVYPLAFALGILEWWDWRYVAMYPFTLGAASFICGTLWEIYLTRNRKREYYTNAQKYYYNLNKKEKVKEKEKEN